MFKNTSSQSLTLQAIDVSTGLPKSGDAANMLFYVSKDDGSVTLITANSGVPTEIDSTNAKGLYKIALAQAETNADKLLFSGKSSTSNIVVSPTVIYTTPAGFTSQVAQTGDSYAALTGANAEPGQGTPAVNASIISKIAYIYKTWRNKKTQTSSTFSLFADDATTVDQKAAVSNDGTTTTIGEIATGP